MSKPRYPRIVVIGGGTGSFTLLSALKNRTKNITALVNMADDGGSTGVLRDELGTLPPGDVRQCLVALSDSPKMRDLFNYRFDGGTFGGHAFGNLFLSALEKVTGNFNDAVETASEVLRVNGTVLPATLDDVRLKMEWPDAATVLYGQRKINAAHFTKDPREAQLSLVPETSANPAALRAIAEADLVIIAPGNLYASLGPLLVIDGIGEALRRTKALKLYVANLVTKRGHTEGFRVGDHADEIERFAGGEFLDVVLYNRKQPNSKLKKRYEAGGAYIVEFDEQRLKTKPYRAVGGNFLGAMAAASKGDSLPVTRSLIRHDQTAVAEAIMKAYNE